jgi:hypothetical protein
MTRVVPWWTAFVVAAAILVRCGTGGGDTCAPGSVKLTGHWDGNWSSAKGLGEGSISFFSIVQSGSAVKGQVSFGRSLCISGGAVSGSICGDTFTGALSADGIEVKLSATVTGTQMSSGSYNMVSAGACTGDTGIFSAQLR